ncbi:MAG TPA: phosphate acyltransferase PlsX [Clostridia bacterium]|jgi:glycerol-3-phosphate acyltransferase PlsX|nr:phosphate acyltransferase PlsX [Clostridia bacterium]
MKIALDAMGGDFAPEETVKGAILAAKEKNIEVLLVGDKGILTDMLKQYGGNDLPIRVIHAAQQIEMGEHPVKAVRTKKDSSLVVGANLVKQKEAAALVSAGSTGAAMAASLFNIGRIKGIERPAIGTMIPTLKGPLLLLDAGANTDCRPKHLKQFAVMGSIYSQEMFGLSNPRVGLLNIGEEETKGNELTIEAYKILSETPVNFVGNIEARDILKGDVDVLVCDGFIGNVVLKYTEGLASALFAMIKEEITSTFVSKIAAGILKPRFKALKNRLDYSEYGGAPLLGIDGVTIISHGSSDAKAIKNALAVAFDIAEKEIPEKIKKQLNIEDGGE